MYANCCASVIVAAVLYITWFRVRDSVSQSVASFFSLCCVVEVFYYTKFEFSGQDTIINQSRFSCSPFKFNDNNNRHYITVQLMKYRVKLKHIVLGLAFFLLEILYSSWGLRQVNARLSCEKANTDVLST
jgi:hypothetical protein